MSLGHVSDKILRYCKENLHGTRPNSGSDNDDDDNNSSSNSGRWWYRTERMTETLSHCHGLHFDQTIKRKIIRRHSILLKLRPIQSVLYWFLLISTISDHFICTSAVIVQFYESYWWMSDFYRLNVPNALAVIAINECTTDFNWIVGATWCISTWSSNECIYSFFPPPSPESHQLWTEALRKNTRLLVTTNSPHELISYVCANMSHSIVDSFNRK